MNHGSTISEEFEIFCCNYDIFILESRKINNEIV